MKDAMFDGLITYNPVPETKPYKRKKPKIRILSKEKIKELLDAAAKNPWYLEILLGLFCGLRKGEILGLKECDFDFEKEYGFDPSLMDNNYEEDSGFLSMQQPADSIPEAPQNYVEDAADYGDMFQAPSYDEEPVPYYDAQPEEPVYEEEQQPQYDPQEAEEVPAPVE